MDDKLTLVSSPDIWFGTSPNLFLYGCDSATQSIIVQQGLASGLDLALTIGGPQDDPAWALGAAAAATWTLANLEHDSILSGILLTRPRVWWYNTDSAYLERVNNNRVVNPVQFTARILDEYQEI